MPGVSSRALDGFAVGVTADRRWEEQAELLSRRGIAVVHGPTIRTLPLRADPVLLAVTEDLVARPPDVVVANTAIGMRSWLSEADSHGLGDPLIRALHQARVVARGPKAAGAMHAAGVEVAWRTPSETLAELRDLLLAEGVAGARVAFQRDGDDDAPPAVADLVAAGADVVEVPVYRWQLPEDPRPAVRLAEAAIEGRVQAVTFTSGPAVRNLLRIARDAGLDQALLAAFAPHELGGRSAVGAVCVGPVCARIASEQGLGRVVTPQRARLGPMIRTLEGELRTRVATIDLGDREVEVRGTTVDAEGLRAELGGRELQLLQALARRPGAVVSKRELLGRVWERGTSDPHVVEVTIGRLRRRLEPLGIGVVNVPRRGYRLDRDR